MTITLGSGLANIPSLDLQKLRPREEEKKYFNPSGIKVTAGTGGQVSQVFVQGEAFLRSWPHIQNCHLLAGTQSQCEATGSFGARHSALFSLLEISE